MRRAGIVLAGLAAVCLAGCGGGGGDSEASSTSAGTTTRTTGGSTTPTTTGSTSTTDTTARPPRLVGTLRKGQRVVFRPSRIQVGDTVKCKSGAATVEARVPKRGTGTFKHAEGSGKASATISLGTRSNGSVVAQCL